MPDSYVTCATVTNGMIKLSVSVDEFQPGDYVQITGQATQTCGAFATFYAIQQVPAERSTDPSDPANKEEHLYIWVTATPVPHKFSSDEDITAFLSVAECWLTVLGKPTASNPGETLSGLGGGGTTWGQPRSVAQLGGDSWIDRPDLGRS